MSVYYIDPNIDVNEFNFKEIMDSMTNDISNLFTYNRNLIVRSNYNNTIDEIVNVVSKFLKVYNFYNNQIKNINIQIYNSNIEVIINVEFIIYETFFIYKKSDWEGFYNGFINKNPIVYKSLDVNKKKELRISLVNGNFYMYDDIEIELQVKEEIINNEGIILKKELCTCENIKNCNIDYSYIITVYWPIPTI